MTAVSRLMLGLALATLLLGSGGFTAEATHAAVAPQVPRYALLVALESHDADEGIALEHHACADGCAAMSTIAVLTDSRVAMRGPATRSFALPKAARLHALAIPLALFHPPR